MSRVNTPKDLARAKKWRESHKAEQRKYFLRLHHEGKSWGRRNPEKVKAKRRRRTLRQYGLTPELWDQKFASQGRACAICRSPEPHGGNWATDHDHETGKTRGILCCRCNAGIGQLQDSPGILRLAAEYLERYKG